MGSRGKRIEVDDFSGGLNTYDPEYNLDLNQSPDAQNIDLLTKGFKKRFGDTVFNSDAMVSGSTAVTGLGYIKINSGTEFLNAVAGTKFFTSTGLIGTMTDATGAITITSAVTNLWTPLNYNNLQIWFGGAPDAPFKYSGTGNAAALGGTPPSASTGFVANNRVFAISTAANPSTIYWCVLSNPEDWTGTGSGNADVSKSDGEALQCGVVLSTDTAILFKNSSTHLMTLTRQPFPVYVLQKGIGIAGRNAYASVKGKIYFITPSRRMMATMDGRNFESFSTNISPLWDSINPIRIPYIQGVYYQNLEQIHWYVSTGSSTTNNLCIVWDIEGECWLQHPTGFKANVACLAQNRRLFCGHYDGKVYEKDRSGVYTDASEASPGAIDSYWRTPFRSLGSLSLTIHPQWVDFSCLTEVSSVMEASYGFDFVSTQNTQSLSIVAVGAQWDVDLWDVGVWGGQNAVIKRFYTFGRGNMFSFKLRNAIASQGFTCQGASVQLRGDGAQKEFTQV